MANPDHLRILQDAIEKNDISIWNDWRRQNRQIRLNLDNIDLSNEDLQGIDLSNTDLFRTNFIASFLEDANISNSSLALAEFGDASLSRADFHESTLVGANFIGANLRHVSLMDADLGEAIFQRSLLDSANLTNTLLDETVFSDLDLSTIKNLDKANIKGPCTIGIDTLYKSQTLLSESWFQDFLRDCGIPETMVTYVSSLVVKPIDCYSCFISYSSANEDFAKLLYDTLRGQNIRVWYAPEQILPGHNIKHEIIRGIQHWDKVILCCSESSLTEKWWVDFERTLAETKAQDLQREYKQSNPVIIPLDLDGYVHDGYKKHADYDPFLSSYHIADFRDWKNHDSFKREVNRLIRALQTDDGREPPPPNKLKPLI